MRYVEFVITDECLIKYASFKIIICSRLQFDIQKKKKKKNRNKSN